MKQKFLFTIIALNLFTLAKAQDTAATCAEIEDGGLRLACYDRLYAPKLTSATEPASKSVDLEKTYEASVADKSPQVVFAAPEKTPLTEEPTHLSRLYDLDENRQGGILTVREHESIYLLPAWYRTSPNYTPTSPNRGTAHDNVQEEQKRIEAKMQGSFKTKLMEDLFKTRADVWFGYTQQSNWQLYNQGDESAPFRNNDYAPEIFITQPVKAALPWGGQLRMLGVGYLHQSNGQSRPLSRSWNRIYAMAGMEWDKLTVMPRLWARIDPNSSEDDDNPDITDYMGYGDVKLRYQISDKHTLMSTLRYNPFENKGAIQVGYTFPIKGKLKAYVQGFYGYGESLLDYNHKQTGIGIGVMLNDWNGL
ncbi:phospholipase A [Neisseriaceae bacterium B1]